MVDKLEEIRKRFHAVRDEMMNPDLMKDMDNYAKLSKEYKDLEKIDFKYARIRENTK